MKVNEANLLRWVIIAAIVVYILGVAPQFNEGIRSLFDQPLVKLLLLALIIFVSYMDHTIALLLAVAFVVSMLSAPKNGVMGQLTRGTQQLMQLPEKAMHDLPLPAMHKAKAPVKENMDAGSHQLGGAQQAYEAQAMMDQQASGYYPADSSCMALPPPSGGCDPIVGYNAPYDCICAENCVGDCAKKGRGCLCTGVATWKDELNAQGMNYPMGNPGGQDGATY